MKGGAGEKRRNQRLHDHGYPLVHSGFCHWTWSWHGSVDLQKTERHLMKHIFWRIYKYDGAALMACNILGTVVVEFHPQEKGDAKFGRAFRVLPFTNYYLEIYL